MMVRLAFAVPRGQGSREQAPKAVARSAPATLECDFRVKASRLRAAPYPARQRAFLRMPCGGRGRAARQSTGNRMSHFSVAHGRNRAPTPRRHGVRGGAAAGSTNSRQSRRPEFTQFSSLRCSSSVFISQNAAIASRRTAIAVGEIDEDAALAGPRSPRRARRARSRDQARRAAGFEHGQSLGDDRLGVEPGRRIEPLGLVLILKHGRARSWRGP